MKEVKEKFVTIRITEATLKKVKAEAAKETRSVSSQILHYIKNALGDKK